MTHENIYTKFLIEYDKANITSSYPSLTKYEVATLLNKAYLALIALKVTGNNPRRAGFESDIKSISDIKGLITHLSIATSLDDIEEKASNENMFDIPSDFMYYVQSICTYNDNAKSNVKLVNHDLARQFRVTETNYPWVKEPVCHLDAKHIHVLCDPTKTVIQLYLMYVKEPIEFSTTSDDYIIEISDTAVEELINLAIVFATEITESPRLQTKSSTLSLES